MSTFLPSTTARAVHWWVRLYTLGLPPALQDDRRTEIQSDLWEQAQEATLSGMESRRLAWLTLRRLFLGVPADLAWRTETDGLIPRFSGLLFAVLAAIGFQLALRGPGIPDSDSPARELNAFFAENGTQMMAGHVFMWFSVVVLVRLVLRINHLRADAQGGVGWLSFVALGSGVSTGLLLGLVFVLTGIAAFQGANGDLQTMRALYPTAGFIFHVHMSIALIVFLASTAILCLRANSLPEWAGSTSVILAIVFVLESIGAMPVYLLPQALFLVWAVAMGATMRRGTWATR